MSEAVARAERASMAQTAAYNGSSTQAEKDASDVEHSAAFDALADVQATSMRDLADKAQLAAEFCHDLVLQCAPEDDDSDHGIGWRLLAGIVRDAQRLARLEARS